MGMPLVASSVMITKEDRSFVSYHVDFEVTEELKEEIYQSLKGAKVIERIFGVGGLFYSKPKGGIKNNRSCNCRGGGRTIEHVF